MDRPRQLNEHRASERIPLAISGICLLLELRSGRFSQQRSCQRRSRHIAGVVCLTLLCGAPHLANAQFPPLHNRGEFLVEEQLIYLPDTEPFLALRRPAHPLATLTRASLDEATRIIPDEQGRAAITLSTLAAESRCLVFAPKATGLYVVRVQRDGRSIGAEEVAVMNDSFCTQQPVLSEDSIWPSSECRFWLRADHDYYVVHRSQQSTLQPTQLSVDLLPDADAVEERKSVKLDHNGNGRRRVLLKDPNQPAHFLVESPITGLLEIDLKSVDLEVDPMLRVLDADSLGLIDVNDDAPDGTANARIKLFAQQGQRFVVEASLYAGVGGQTWLTFRGVSGKSIEEIAEPIEIAPETHVQIRGELSDAEQRDFFRFVSPFDGPLTIQMSSANAGQIDPLISVFDNEQRLVDMDDDSLNGQDASLTIFAVAGREYFLRAGSYGDGLGAYRLEFWPGGAPTPFDRAVGVRTHPAGYATLRNEITRDIPYRLFRLDSPAHSQFDVSMVNGMSSDLNSRLILFDQNQQAYAEAETDERDGSTRLRFVSQANELFYLMATSADESLGAFSLVVRRSDREPPLQTPRMVGLTPQHRLYLHDEFRLLREEKAYQFVSSYTGSLIARCEGAGANAPDVKLTICDQAGRTLACNHGLVIGSFEESADAAVSFDAKMGSTYTMLVGMDNATPGPFELTVVPGELEGPFAHARQLLFKDQSAVTVVGHSDGTTRGHYYRFEAPVTGKISIVQRSVIAGEVDSLLSLYDRDGRELALNDDTFETDAAITQHVRKGETYFIRAGSYEGTHGDYRLSLTLGDLPSPFEDAIAIDLMKWPRWLRAGSLEAERLTQYYKLTAPRFGKLIVTLRAGAASDLDSLLVLYNEAGVEIDASDDAFAGSLDAQIVHIAKPAETYFVAVASADERPGAYEVGIEFEEMKDPFDVALPVELRDGEFRVKGKFADAVSTSVYRWEPTADGRYRVCLASAGEDSTVDTLLSVFDQDRELVAMNDDTSETETDSELILEVRRGQALYLQAGQYSGTAGEFSLMIVPAPLKESSN